MLYAGLGPISTPAPVFQAMRDLARALAVRGFTLRSGGAGGAETAFELGAAEVFGDVEVFLPWKGFNGRPYSAVPLSKNSFDLAETVNPSWSTLSFDARKLRARNMYQVLGASLKDPVDFVICWTNDGNTPQDSGAGECSSAIILADRRGIPVYNLANPDASERLRARLTVDGGTRDTQLALF